MDTLNLREATLNDLPILLQFEQGIVTAERPFNVTLKEGPINYYDLKALISDEDATVIVAEQEGVLVGSGFAIIKPAKPYLDHEHYAYLGFMYTDPAYRGRGVNRKIIEGLKSWALSKGLAEIRLTVYSDNEPAIRAYEKVGFKKHILEMRLA